MNIKKNVKIILHSRDRKLRVAACALLFCLAAAMYIFFSGGQEEVKVDTAPHIQMAEKESGRAHEKGRMIYSVSGDAGRLRNPFTFQHEREGERPANIAAAVNKSAAEALSLKDTARPAQVEYEQKRTASDDTAYVLKAVMEIGGRKMAIADIGGRTMRLSERDRAGGAAVVSIGRDSMVLEMADGSVKTCRLR